jgi:fructokinase
MEARWGKPAHELSDDLVWDLEARYLALGLVCVICVLSPERVVIGGGVMNRAGLLQLVQREIVALMNGYLGAPPLAEGISGFVTSPGLGARAGVLGALALAESP